MTSNHGDEAVSQTAAYLYTVASVTPEVTDCT
jgi:hypothetical protein